VTLNLDGRQLTNSVRVGENGLWSFSTTSSGITSSAGHKVQAISPNGGTYELAVQNAVLPGTPARPTQPVQGESGRFVSSTREHSGENLPKDVEAPRKLNAPKPVETKP
jgi:hypothetical protein